MYVMRLVKPEENSEQYIILKIIMVGYLPFGFLFILVMITSYTFIFKDHRGCNSFVWILLQLLLGLIWL